MSVLTDIDRPENTPYTTMVGFDFDCDNAVEIVHRNLETLSIFRGDGTVLMEQPCLSATGAERVVVADIDGDGDTDILTQCTPPRELIAFSIEGSPPSRPLDNQFTTFAVQVRDDLTIPCRQQDHAAAGLHPLLRTFMLQPPLFDAAGRSCGDVCTGGCAGTPGRVGPLLGVKRSADVELRWPPAADAMTYNGYRVLSDASAANKRLIASANAVGAAAEPAIEAVSTCTAVPVLTCADPGAVPAPPVLLFYQLVASCDGTTEGPN